MKGCYIIVLVVERYENKTQGYALLAQLVEQRTLNPRVRGSSPRRRITKYRFWDLDLGMVLFLLYKKECIEVIFYKDRSHRANSALFVAWEQRLDTSA